jgi:hypothetical protein
MASESPTVTPKEKSLIELFGELTWEEIKADGIITLSEIEKELEAKGYPPDSHDYLYDE